MKSAYGSHLYRETEKEEEEEEEEETEAKMKADYNMQ